MFKNVKKYIIALRKSQQQINFDALRQAQNMPRNLICKIHRRPPYLRPCLSRLKKHDLAELAEKSSIHSSIFEFFRRALCHSWENYHQFFIFEKLPDESAHRLLA